MWIVCEGGSNFEEAHTLNFNYYHRELEGGGRSTLTVTSRLSEAAPADGRRVPLGADSPIGPSPGRARAFSSTSVGLGTSGGHGGNSPGPVPLTGHVPRGWVDANANAGHGSRR